MSPDICETCEGVGSHEQCCSCLELVGNCKCPEFAPGETVELECPECGGSGELDPEYDDSLDAFLDGHGEP